MFPFSALMGKGSNAASLVTAFGDTPGGTLASKGCLAGDFILIGSLNSNYFGLAGVTSLGNDGAFLYASKILTAADLTATLTSGSSSIAQVFRNVRSAVMKNGSLCNIGSGGGSGVFCGFARGSGHVGIAAFFFNNTGSGTFTVNGFDQAATQTNSGIQRGYNRLTPPYALYAAAGQTFAVSFTAYGQICPIELYA